MLDIILVYANILWYSGNDAKVFMGYDVYAALGNETRVKLLLCLAAGSKNVTDLIRTCGLSQSAVSQHLSKLKQAGLVRTQKEGKIVWYSLRHRIAADVCWRIRKLKEEIV